MVAPLVSLGGCMLGTSGMGLVEGAPGMPVPFARATPAGVAGLVGGNIGGGIGAGSSQGGVSAPEDPLPETAAVKALAPAPPAVDSLRFRNGSRYFVWVDESGDNVMVGEVGGTVRRLADYNRGPAYDPRWSADGEKLLIIDNAQRSAGLGGGSSSAGTLELRARIFPLGGGDPLAIGRDDVEAFSDVLPDGSGITWARGVQAPGAKPIAPTPPGAVSAPALRRLFVRLPGKPAEVVAETPHTRAGIWSWDAQEYAYIGYRDGNPLEGMDISILDRRTAASRLAFHLETDYFWPDQEGNFRWTQDRRIAFAQRLVFGATASVTVTSIPADGSPAEIALFPIALGSGETLGNVVMAPDGRTVAFTTTRTVKLTGPNWSTELPKSQGIQVGTWDDGAIRKLTTGGRPVAWLPDSRRLVTATGGGQSLRYYLIDTATASEALQ